MIGTAVHIYEERLPPMGGLVMIESSQKENT